VWLWVLVGGASLIAGGAGAVLLPPEGVVLNRIHVQFEWTPVGGAVSYQLQVVEDDGNADPFANATPVVDATVAATVPRAPITSGFVVFRWFAGLGDQRRHPRFRSFFSQPQPKSDILDD
jgi:hypothetical protein